MLDLLVPILHHLNEARADPSRLGLIHISVFLLLLLSGERNFGVRLNERCKLTKCVFFKVAVFLKDTKNYFDEVEAQT
jgi:hypothetical protein